MTNDIRAKKSEIVQTVKFFLQIVIYKTQKKTIEVISKVFNLEGRKNAAEGSS